MTGALYRLAAMIDEGDISGVPTNDLSNATLQNALKITVGIAGAIAVLIIVLAGFKYILARGNPQETAKAKNTIIAAAIGLVVSLLAFSIVTFVVGRL